MSLSVSFARTPGTQCWSSPEAVVFVAANRRYQHVDINLAVVVVGWAGKMNATFLGSVSLIENILIT